MTSAPCGARNGDLLGSAAQLSLDVAVFDRTGPASRWRTGSARMWNCASYLMMRPPSAHSTWPVIAAAASEAR
jgi:hypothetical protein